MHNVQSYISFRDGQQTVFVTMSCTAVLVMEKHLCPIIVNDKHVIALLDLGIWVTPVKPKVTVPVDFQARSSTAVCINNDTQKYSIATMKLGTA